MKRLKVMADYQSYAVWDVDDPTNVDPDSLPISPELRSGLHQWAEAYDATLNMDDPTASGFPSAEEERKFADVGRELARRLAEELGPEFDIVYFDHGRLIPVKAVLRP